MLYLAVALLSFGLGALVVALCVAAKSGSEMAEAEYDPYGDSYRGEP